jgi:hypothetical protein
MSLAPFNGSIANPAQSAVNLGGNDLSNVNEAYFNYISCGGNVESGNAVVIKSSAGFDFPRLEMKGGSTGATGAGYITFFPDLLRFEASQEVYGRAAVGGDSLFVRNNTDLQKLEFYDTASYGATGAISYVPSETRFTCDQNFNIAGTCEITGAATALNTLTVGGLARFENNFILVSPPETTTPQIELTNGATGALQCAISFDTVNGVLSSDAGAFQIKPAAATANLRFSTTSNFPANMTYNYNDGFRIGTEFGTNTFIFGATGATAGATAANPFLKVSGASGEGRVYDTVYNPVPSVQTYGQFSLNSTFNIGSTGGTAAGVADTATQVSLDTDVISEGCSLSSGGISVAAAGKYNITVSPQFYNTGSGNHNVYFWFRVNSTDVANSATGIYLQGNNAQQVPTVSVVLDLAANDVVKIMAAADDDEIQCLNVGAISSPYSRPAAPAIIATIVRVA